MISGLNIGSYIFIKFKLPVTFHWFRTISDLVTFLLTTTTFLWFRTFICLMAFFSAVVTLSWFRAFVLFMAFLLASPANLRVGTVTGKMTLLKTIEVNKVQDSRL